MKNNNLQESITSKQANNGITDFTDKKTGGLTNADITNVAIMNTDVESKTDKELNNSSLDFADFTDKKTGDLTNADVINVAVMNNDVESNSAK